MKVAVVLPADFDDAAEFLADVRALEVAGTEMVAVEGGGDDAVLGAIAAVTHRMKIRVSSAGGVEVLQRLSRGRAVTRDPEGERWAEVPMPADRVSWVAMLREQEAAGAQGVIVPWGPRLLDLLRNPEPEDRGDLLMSTG